MPKHQLFRAIATSTKSVFHKSLAKQFLEVAITKNRRYPESKVVVNNNTKQAADNSEVDDSGATPKTSANKQHAIAIKQNIDIQISKNITSSADIIKKYVFDCFPANYTVW